jgi:hypothetical protein
MDSYESRLKPYVCTCITIGNPCVLHLHSCDKDSNKMVSPEQGENQSLSVSAMKGEMHSAKEMADAQGETDNNDDELPCLIP